MKNKKVYDMLGFEFVGLQLRATVGVWRQLYVKIWLILSKSNENDYFWQFGIFIRPLCIKVVLF
jgi:hypothetical protein